jgi:hypothetical protein
MSFVRRLRGIIDLPAVAIMGCCIAVPHLAIRSLVAKAYLILQRVFAMAAMFIPNAMAWSITLRLIFAKVVWLILRDAMERSIIRWNAAVVFM